MGLLDSIVGHQPGLAGELMNLLGGAQGGGIANVMRAFERNGLGELIASWISTGRNLPVSAEQIAQVLGGNSISQLATRFGISPEQAAAQISQLLPQIVDGLTPHGSVPDSDALQEGLSALRSKLGL